LGAAFIPSLLLTFIIGTSAADFQFTRV
jgi:hypothetical protein